MSTESRFEDVFLHPLSGELSLILLERLSAGTDLTGLTAAVLPMVSHATGSGALGVLVQQAATWTPIAWVGRAKRPPDRAITLAADQLQTIVSEGWVLAPIPRWPQGVALLAARDDGNPMTPLEPALAATAALLGLAGNAERGRWEDLCQRLTALMKASTKWRRMHDTDGLLKQMAETAAKLLDSDRASIFLLDQRRGVLVGRPALGIAGGKLEVAANAGVVGAVMQSGLPRRWSRGDPRDEVNRKIDKQTQYETRSLIAVPMRNPGGKVIGVFEVLNRHNDLPYQKEDETMLQLLADQAAVTIDLSQEREKLLDSRERVTVEAAATAEIVGKHPEIDSLRAAVSRVAKTELAVLLLGANGTGKEVIARAIHYNSPRRQEPFIAVNCAALVETLLESELFGHEKGAFTDALASRPGKFELAHEGTLFLDEIGDLTPGGQAKLLRVLEEKIVIRVGGSTPISTDVRVIAATNQPLAEWVGKGKFREDLFYRLNVVTLRLPPLRERGDDILLLAEHFLEQFCRRAGRALPKIGEQASRLLLRHSWPGNVRELRNLMERVAYLSVGDEVVAEDIELVSRPSVVKEPTGEWDELDLAEATRLFQIRHIEQCIQRNKGQMTDVADQLGLHRPNLYRKLKQLGLERGEK